MPAAISVYAAFQDLLRARARARAEPHPRLRKLALDAMDDRRDPCLQHRGMCREPRSHAARPGSPTRSRQCSRKGSYGREGVRRSCSLGSGAVEGAENEANSLPTRFDLAYCAAHALCRAALRHYGFRPSKRYAVFRCCRTRLAGPEVWRVLSKCHDKRNRTECEGAFDFYCRRDRLSCGTCT